MPTRRNLFVESDSESFLIRRTRHTKKSTVNTPITISNFYNLEVTLMGRFTAVAQKIVDFFKEIIRLL
jgi:hypothetical protein